MANKRNAKSIVNKSQQNDTVPSEAPLFVVENEESKSKEITPIAEETLTENKEEKEILKEIQEVMAEGAYNKGEQPKKDEEEEEDAKIFVTNDIPLANRGKEDVSLKNNPSPKEKKKKAGVEKELTAEQKERKAKREAKKAAYKKTTLKHKLFVMGVLVVLGIFTGSGLGVWYFNVSLKSSVDYSKAGNPEDYVQSVSDTLSRNFSEIDLNNMEDWVAYAKGLGKTPEDLSPVDNFVLAQYNATIADSYSVIGSGSVVAQTIITVDQFLYSEKKFDGEKYSFISISPDTTGMVGDVAVCDVLSKGANTIQSYKGAIHEGNTSADWSYNTTLTTSEHSNLNGVKVNDVQPYLICTETVVSSSEITVDENGNYVFTLELDTIKAVLNYIKQVKRTGGLSTYPEFKSLKTTFTITPDWQLVKMNVVEVYKAVKMGMTPTITGTIDFDITINQPIEMPNLPEIS